MGFLPQETCNVTIPVFSSPGSGPPFFWPGTWLGLDPSVTLVCSKRDLLDIWVLPVGMASPGWIGRCTLGLPFTHGFIQSFQRSLLICHTLKLAGQGLYFTGMIIWLQYSFPLWELQMLCYEWMLWLILLNRHDKILKKLFQLLMLNKHKLER